MTGALEWLVYGAPYDKYDFIYALLNFLGVIFIAKPAFFFPQETIEAVLNENHFYGVVMMLLSALTFALYQIFAR